MRRARWMAPWKDSEKKPAIYHCISRVVERRFVFGDEEREQFRIFMRMYENFSGCRVLSYCVMSNHIHILLEVPPMPKEGLTDEELLRRLSAIYSDTLVGEVAAELAAAREKNMAEQAASCKVSNKLSKLLLRLGGFALRFGNETHTVADYDF